VAEFAKACFSVFVRNVIVCWAYFPTDALLTELQTSTTSVAIFPQVECNSCDTLFDSRIMDRRMYSQCGEPVSAEILDSDGEVCTLCGF